MEILNAKQGSDEWHTARAAHYCASDAPAAMGTSAYKTRNQLLRELVTGVAPTVDVATQARFDRGHTVELMARPIAESMIGEDLYPVVMVEQVEGLRLLASVDGMTMDDSLTWEHKLYNQDLAGYISLHGDLPDSHWPQVEHQFIVSGCRKCLFMVSDGTKDECVTLRYKSRDERRDQVIAAWKQIDADRKTFVIEEAPQKVVVEIETLPAVFANVSGSLTVNDNLDMFGTKLREFVTRINPEPKTDEDFATLNAAVKTLKKAEDALDGIESQALAQVSSIDTLIKAKSVLHTLARDNRLLCERLVKNEKENRKAAIVLASKKALADYLQAIPERQYMPVIEADFGGAIKGLSSLSSVQNAVDTALANAKIAASDAANKIRMNLDLLTTAGAGYEFLFSDKQGLVLKAVDDLLLVIDSRINAHKAEQSRKEEETRERIRAEEQAKAEKDAAAKLAAEQDKLAAEQAAAVGHQEAVNQPVQAPAPVVTTEPMFGFPMLPRTDSAAPTDAPTMTLGAIGTRLGFTVSADFLRGLGISPAGKAKAATLYHESDFPKICHAIIQHIASVANLKQAA